VKQITLVQLGIGTVGGEVVAQVLAQRERWRRDLAIGVAIGAIIGRDGALVADDPAGWRTSA
jgi:homoserine dehydrogenase